MPASLFVRMSGAIASHVELGLEAAEKVSRRPLSRQAVREIEAVIDDLEAQGLAAERARADAASQKAKHITDAVEWGERAAYALGKDRSDLAGQAIGRQLDAERGARAATEREEQANRDAEQLKTLVTDLEAERRRMMEDLRALERDRPADPIAVRADPSVELRIRRARTRFERLMNDETAERAHPSAEESARDIEALRRADQVAERLAMLREAAGKSVPDRQPQDR